jgi:hypothetical protein
VQRFRQADPSWFRRGQTTTLFSSFTENEPVSGARGGIASIGQSILGGAVRSKLSGVFGLQWQRCSFETDVRSLVGAPGTVSELRRLRMAGSGARRSLQVLWCVDVEVEGC